MNKDDYQQYLQSSHWRKIKAQYKRRYKEVCYLCKAVDRLHLHHVTYERIGHELLTDLVYLCENCHSFIHQDGQEARDLRAWINPVLRPAQGMNEKSASWETGNNAKKPAKKTKAPLGDECTLAAIGIYKDTYCVRLGNKQYVKSTGTEDWERVLLFAVLEVSNAAKDKEAGTKIRIELQEQKDGSTLSCLRDIRGIKARNWRTQSGYKMLNTDLWGAVFPFCSSRNVKFVVNTLSEQQNQSVITAKKNWFDRQEIREYHNEHKKTRTPGKARPRR